MKKGINGVAKHFGKTSPTISAQNKKALKKP